MWTKKKIPVTEQWQKYQNGIEHHEQTNMYKKDLKCHNFYRGKQWEGVKAGGEELPIFNFIKPITKYKVSTIAQNTMAIIYSNMGEPDPEKTALCELLTKNAAVQWEQNKMDVSAWQVLKRANITGDCYLYSFAEKSDTIVPEPLKMIHRIINRTNVYFSDEQNPNINSQEYIIIDEGRKPVSQLREIAKLNKVRDIELIVADEETTQQIGENSNEEVKTELGKTTSILYMQKTAKGIEFCRSTQGVVYEPMQTIEGMEVYPLIGMRWEELIGSARGQSAVEFLIPNQIEVNANAFRWATAVKRYAFPTRVYDPGKINNINDLKNVGADISIKNLDRTPINTVIDFLNPQGSNPDTQSLSDMFINTTRELEGAGEAATGQIDPTKASGESIKAARDQAAVPLNEQIALYKQFVEDYAMLNYHMLKAYSKNGVVLTYEENGEQVTRVVTQAELNSLDLTIRIDVSPIDPYSRLSQEIALERLMVAGNITFEEYIEALSDTSTVPKGKLQAILDARAKLKQDAELAKIEELGSLLMQMQEMLLDAGIPAEQIPQIGGEINATNEMQPEIGQGQEGMY